MIQNKHKSKFAKYTTSRERALFNDFMIVLNLSFRLLQNIPKLCFLNVGGRLGEFLTSKKQKIQVQVNIVIT